MVATYPSLPTWPPSNIFGYLGVFCGVGKPVGWPPGILFYNVRLTWAHPHNHPLRTEQVTFSPQTVFVDWGRDSRLSMGSHCLLGKGSFCVCWDAIWSRASPSGCPCPLNHYFLLNSTQPLSSNLSSLHLLPSSLSLAFTCLLVCQTFLAYKILYR